MLVLRKRGILIYVKRNLTSNSFTIGLAALAFSAHHPKWIQRNLAAPRWTKPAGLIESWRWGWMCSLGAQDFCLDCFFNVMTTLAGRQYHVYDGLQHAVDYTACPCAARYNSLLAVVQTKTNHGICYCPVVVLPCELECGFIADLESPVVVNGIPILFNDHFADVKRIVT